MVPVTRAKVKGTGAGLGAGPGTRVWGLRLRLGLDMGVGIHAVFGEPNRIDGEFGHGTGGARTGWGWG